MQVLLPILTAFPLLAPAHTTTLLRPPGQQESADPVVARFVHVDGTAGAVTRSQLARDVAERHRHDEDGEAALRLLIDRHLVELEANAAGIEPTAKEIDARIDEIGAVLASQGSSLDAFLQAKRMSRAQFGTDFIRQQVRHERLVMKSLELKDRSEVSPDLLELWLVEARTRHEITDVAAELPADVVARVDDRSFHLDELGATLLPNVPDEERAKFVRRIVLRELLQREAEHAGIRVTETDTRAEIDRRRAKIEADPRYRGISYENWLKTTQGLTIDELARSPQMVATVQQQRLVAAKVPKAALQARLRDDRDAVLRRHGEKRKLAMVLVRATERPNELVKRDFDAARTEIAALRERIVSGKETFQRIAQMHSEDPYSKVRGGELGEFPRESDELPDAILAAAFALDVLAISEPIRVGQGYVIVRVGGLVPAPDDTELLERLQDDAAQKFLADLVESAKIEFVR